MTLDRLHVESLASEYADAEPLYTVEAEGVETLPGAFSSGEYGWRDAAWVVRWYCRRSLRSGSDAPRRAIEDEFEDNGMDAVRDAIAGAVEADDVDHAFDRLLTLAGVDVPVASAFLFYIDPTTYLAVGEREWTALLEADELGRPYPDSPSVDDYGRYLGACRGLSEQYGYDLWSLYRALRRYPGVK